MKWKSYTRVLKKNKNKKKTKKNDRIFSLEWNIAYWLLRGPCFEFYGDGKHGLFEPKRWWKYDVYWLLKVLVLKFSGMENAVFLKSKSCWKDDISWLLKSSCLQLFGDEKMKRSYLLIIEMLFLWATEKFLFWTFQWWEIRSFLQSKRWCKDHIYFVFLSFSWYSRTWEVRFFRHWELIVIKWFLSKTNLIWCQTISVIGKRK